MKQCGNLAIIMARGGSTRIPKKNIIPFLGKPLIGYVIEACQSAAIFDRILVATDDDDIAAVARSYGLEVPFKREFFNSDCMHTDQQGNPINEPDATDRYYMEKFRDARDPFAEYCLEKLAETTGETFAACCVLPANSPFITAQVITDLYQEFHDGQRDFAMTIARCSKHPWFCTYGDYSAPVPIAQEVREKDGRALVLRTQDLPELYLLSSPVFCTAHCRKDAANGGYVKQDYQVCLDIDTYQDLVWYEKLARGLLRTETVSGEP